MAVEQWRADFPILEEEVHGEALIYFDNAATSQTPEPVLAAMMDYYHQKNANIHRGVHTLAERATQAYEGVRKQVKEFINAQDESEIIFTRGTTEGINFTARGLVEPILTPGDVILVTELEHHSNLVPWQEVAKRTGAQLKYVPLKDNYEIDLAALENFDSDAVKAIAIHHVSNVLGVEQPIRKIVDWAHERDILVLVDGAQAVPHQAVDVQALGVDAYTFSGHKMYGPTGIGVWYLNQKHHERTQPVQFGGEMIHQVGLEESNYKESPWKFEAGTMPIAEVVGLGAAIDYIQSIGLEKIQVREAKLLDQLVAGMQAIDGVRIFGEKIADRHGIVSFAIGDIHPHDASSAYDLEGIAVRAGHHCAQPLMRLLDVPATLRASLAFYNTEAEVEQFITSTQRVKEFFEYGLE